MKTGCPSCHATYRPSGDSILIWPGQDGPPQHVSGDGVGGSGFGSGQMLPKYLDALLASSKR